MKYIEMVAFPDVQPEDDNDIFIISGIPAIIEPCMIIPNEKEKEGGKLAVSDILYLSPPPSSLKSSGSCVTLVSSVPSITDPDSVSQSSIGTRSQLSIGTRKESWKTTLSQVTIPFFLAGAGTIGAGILLGIVQKWVVFQNITALLILVPSLQGLKGNLDMCLASRLSTLANKGMMTSKKEILSMVIGNIILVQVQAIVAAVCVAIFAVSVDAIQKQDFDIEDALLLAAAGLCTATSSCFILDFVLIAMIILSHRYNMNPDNLATPLAASIGDVVCIGLLSNIASVFYDQHESNWWILLLTVIIYLCLLPLFVWCVMKNKHTKHVLKSGWAPVLLALMLSGLGGLVLSLVVDQLNGFVVFQPIINGIGGNLVSIQASRISTYLHVTKPRKMGIFPAETKLLTPPWKALFRGMPSAKTARLLIALGLVGQLTFVFIADAIHSGKSTIGAPFVFTYLFVYSIQIMLLLYLAHLLVHLMWRWKIDPDSAVIPYLTSVGDLSGSILLAAGFFFLQSFDITYTG